MWVWGAVGLWVRGSVGPGIRASGHLGVLVGLTLGVLTGCGSGEGPEDCDPISAALVDHIEVTPSSPSLTPGATAQLTATAYSCSGALAGIPFTWESAQSSIVTVTAAGIIAGVMPGGPVRVTAKAQGKEGAASVTVGLVPVASVEVIPATASVGIGRSAQLTARVLDADGNELTGRTVAWSSGDAGIASVSTTGLVTGVALGGPVAITATVEGKSGASQFSVVLVPVSSVTVSPDATTIAAGATVQLTATMRDDQGNILAGRAVAWNSSSAAIAEVSPTGLVTGRQSGGPVTITATSEGVTGSSSVRVEVGAASQLVYITQPSNVAAGTAITPAIVVEARDAGGNRVNGFTGEVTLAIQNNPGGSSPISVTRNAAGGRATFNNVVLNRPGTGYTLIAASTGLTSVTSNPFNVTAGAAASLNFVTQPSSATAGSPIPSFQVEILDGLGNRTPGTVTVTLGTNPGGSTLGGTTSVDAPAGLATFNDLTLNRSGGGYTLVASLGGLQQVSTSFDVSPGAPASLHFTSAPAAVLAGAPFGAAVEALDGAGNRVTGFVGTAVLSLSDGTPGAILSGTLSAGFADGVATFSGLSVDLAGTGYRLQAGAEGLSGAVSDPFAVEAGPATGLRFFVEPTNIEEGDRFPNPVQVEVVDARGNRVLNAGSLVTITLRNANGGGGGLAGISLGGDATRNAVAGLAQFPDLTVNLLLVGESMVRLRAAASGFQNILSAPFVVSPD